MCGEDCVFAKRGKEDDVGEAKMMGDTGGFERRGTPNDDEGDISEAGTRELRERGEGDSEEKTVSLWLWLRVRTRIWSETERAKLVGRGIRVG